MNRNVFECFNPFSNQQINSLNRENGVMAANAIIVVVFVGKKCGIYVPTGVIRSNFVNFENFG